MKGTSSRLPAGSRSAFPTRVGKGPCIARIGTPLVITEDGVPRNCSVAAGSGRVCGPPGYGFAAGRRFTTQNTVVFTT
jgi:hypothetical protein